MYVIQRYQMLPPWNNTLNSLVPGGMKGEGECVTDSEERWSGCVQWENIICILCNSWLTVAEHIAKGSSFSVNSLQPYLLEIMMENGIIKSYLTIHTKWWLSVQ